MSRQIVKTTLWVGLGQSTIKTVQKDTLRITSFRKKGYVVGGYSGENIFYDKLMFSTDYVYEIDFLYPTNYSKGGKQLLLYFLNSWSV